MNKKAQYEIRKTIVWAFVMSVITVSVFAFALQINSFQKNISKVPNQMEAEFTAWRFINSPDCLAYQGKDRIHPGIIEYQKFTEKNLRRCYPSINKKEYQFGLKLSNENKEITTHKYYLNNRDFTLYKSVLIRKGDKVYPETLEIAVQVKT